MITCQKKLFHQTKYFSFHYTNSRLKQEKGHPFVRLHFLCSVFLLSWSTLNTLKRTVHVIGKQGLFWYNIARLRCPQLLAHSLGPIPNILEGIHLANLLTRKFSTKSQDMYEQPPPVHFLQTFFYDIKSSKGVFVCKIINQGTEIKGL